jgi:SAM-dependent methyltransferase
LCTRCCAILPDYRTATALPGTDRQVEFHEAVWPTFSNDEATRLRDDLGNLVAFYRDALGPPGEGLILDIGAGRGGLIAALRAAGYDARGCEPSPGLVARAREAYDFTAEQLIQAPAEAFLGDVAAAKKPVAHLFLWHVIEHVAAPLSLLRQAASLLQPGHCLFLQAPCIRQDYLYPEHLLFVTEPCIQALAYNAGCEVASIGYDHALSFVSFVLKRTAEPVPTGWTDVAFSIDKVVAGLHLQLGRRDEQVRQLEAALARSDAATSEHQRQVADLREMLRRHEQRLAEQDAMLQRSATHLLRKIVKHLRSFGERV